MIKRALYIGIIIFLSSCNDENPLPSGHTGTALAQKNGASWVAKMKFLESQPYGKGFDILMDVYNDQGFHREQIFIFRVQNHFNEQAIFLTSAQTDNDSTGVFYSTSIDDGDVGGDYYDLDIATSNNVIQILNYNPQNAEISGVFNLNLSLSFDDNFGEEPPEKLEFSDGKFTVKVEKGWFD